MTTVYKALTFENPQIEMAVLQNLLALTNDGGIKGFFHYDGTLDVADTADGAGTSNSITVPGVKLGDMVLGRSLGVSTAGLIVTADVTADNTVILRVQNEVGGGNINLASTTLRLFIADLT